MHAVIEHLRAHLLRHLVVLSTVLGMLLVPATCANAAGPHSLFLSPMAKHDASMNHDSSVKESDAGMNGMSADEHAMYISTGHSDTQNEPDSADSNAQLDTPTMFQCDAPVEETGVRLTDLPSTMAMVAVSNPSSIAELDALQFPPSSLPATPRSTIALIGRSIVLELPPPQ